jgi:hypothetical protein
MSKHRVHRAGLAAEADKHSQDKERIPEAQVESMGYNTAPWRGLVGIARVGSPAGVKQGDFLAIQNQL